MSKNKKDSKFRRKINAICIDFRFYSRQKKSAIIKPCLEEYHKQVLEGVSPKSATKVISKSCRETLERNYEKHNKFLSLFIFAFIIGLIACVGELILFNTLFDDMSTSLGFILWTAGFAAIYVIFIIWSGLTHNGRWFGYLFLAIYLIAWLVTCSIFVCFSYFPVDGECFHSVVFDFYDEIHFDIRQFTGVIDSLGECVKPAGVGGDSYAFTDYSFFNLDSSWSLLAFIISLILYLVEHARLNIHYSRNNINNLCTQYGINKKQDRKEIRDGALAKYYAYLDRGISKKGANKQVLSETAEILSRNHRKHSRVLFSFIVVIIFAVFAAIEYTYYGLYFTGGLGSEFIRADIVPYYVYMFALPAVALLFVIMLFAHRHFYWYDCLVVAIILVLMLAQGLNYIDIQDSYNTQLVGVFISYEVGPFYFVQYVQYYDITKSYFIMYDAIMAVVYLIIFIPSFATSHHKIKKERKQKELNS